VSTPSTVPTRAGAARRDVLDEIVQRRRADVAVQLASSAVPRDAARAAADAQGAVTRGLVRDPLLALARPGLHLIAEIKRRSPSAGSLARDLDITARARAYERGGATVISVLVEPHYFGGSIEDLAAVRRAVALPLLAKEFIVDARQFGPLRAAGADLVLLITAAQPLRALVALVRHARDAGLEPLVEAHDRRQVEQALSTDAR
jgi:indole-3-glycerol phosphate synthase